MKNKGGKVAVITGGSSGIGFAIASRFVREEITCIVIGRDAIKLKRAADRLGENAYPVTTAVHLLKLHGSQRNSILSTSSGSKIRFRTNCRRA